MILEVGLAREYPAKLQGDHIKSLFLLHVHFKIRWLIAKQKLQTLRELGIVFEGAMGLFSFFENTHDFTT